ncbi:MAG: M28 family peptidase [Gordonia sp. (in: high G+C Gram-positive bacteria)]|uniref:M28 family peptidase n=1 Tax=Gordonia sp. (in: high G+C Gram-positive bacteria) TaxID=84139 RepID=UPI0039E570E4
MTKLNRWIAGAATAVAGILAIGLAAPLGTGPAQAAGSPLSSEAIYSTAADLVGFAPRATGSAGGAATADYIQNRFRGVGLDRVYTEQSTSYDWHASNAGLSVAGTAIDAFPVQHSFIPADAKAGTRTTGPNGRSAPVVDIGAGGIDGKNVKGKIVLFDLAFYLPTAGLLPLTEYINDPTGELVDPEMMLTANPYLTSLESTIRNAQQAGAVGFVGVLRDYFDSNRYHNEYYRKLAMTIPGMWVTRKEGARLRALLARHGHRARIDLTVQRRAVTGRTVIGILNGRSRDTLMVQSHHDSIGPGAVEDATGAAEVMALADHYGRAVTAGRARRPAKTLMFITFDTHFTGYQAHQAFVDKYITRKATPYRIVGNATIEHVGKYARKTRAGRLITTDEAEPKGIFENVNPALKAAMAQSLSRRNVKAANLLNASPFQLIDSGIPTDASFVLTAGVPIVSFICGPMYMYDDADTLDKIDRTQLRPVALFFRDVIERLQATPSASIGLVP